MTYPSDNQVVMRRFDDLKNNRVTFEDERFYLADRDKDLWYPSVTTILDLYPKGKQFKDWLKGMGFNSEIVAARAAESGTRVHAVCEKVMNGIEPDWEEAESHLTLEEWQGAMRFDDFQTRFTPDWEAVEVNTFSHKFKYAGTIDIVCMIGDVRWLLDIKFGNAVYPPYFMQIAAYRQSWEEANPDHKIDEMGILHLKAATRTDGKPPTMQGKSWQVVKPKETYERLFEMFRKVQGIFEYEHPNAKPRNFTVPTRIIPWQNKK